MLTPVKPSEIPASNVIFLDRPGKRHKLLRVRNIFTTSQAADYLGVSPARVGKLIRDKRLAAKKQGRDYAISFDDLEIFAKYGRKNIGRPKETNAEKTAMENTGVYKPETKEIRIGNGKIHTGDALKILPAFEEHIAQTVIADPPYFQVLPDEDWDNRWGSENDYLEWTLRWVKQCGRILRPDGILYVFGQLGKREHVWLHTCSLLAKEMQFHDMIIWDRAVGYNERHDSFTPQYEMILALRKSAGSKPYFNKDAVRIPYGKEKIQTYLRDKRYKDKQKREKHLLKGKYATNILRVPSLKGSSKEKVGHPAQKPVTLVSHLIRSSSRKGDLVIDPFLGSGTTAEVAETNNRRWIGIEQNPKYAKMAKRRIELSLAQKNLPSVEYS